MEQLPIVSVCMITYNHEKFIEEAINGVLLQECEFEIELILANDCSTDKADEVIQNMLKTHPKASMIKYFKHEKNIGMMPNFIFALQQCKGKYIALCEGDDYWTDPLKLQKQVDFLEGNDDYSGCFHNTMMINEKDVSPVLKAWRTYTKETFLLEDTISEIALFHTSSFVFKRKLLFLPEWFSKVQSGDMALFALIASKGPLHRIDNFMSMYRKNETGITNTITLNDYHKNRIKLLAHFKETFTEDVHYKILKVINHHKQALSKLKKDSIKNGILKILRFR